MTAPRIHPSAADGFASNADDYERTRPGYPPAAVAKLAIARVFVNVCRMVSRVKS